MCKRVKEVECHHWYDDPYYYHPNNKRCPVCGTIPKMYRRIGGEAKIGCNCGTIKCGAAHSLRKWWNSGGWKNMYAYATVN